MSNVKNLYILYKNHASTNIYFSLNIMDFNISNSYRVINFTDNDTYPWGLRILTFTSNSFTIKEARNMKQYPSNTQYGYDFSAILPICIYSF